MPREFKPIYRTKVDDIYIRVDKVITPCRCIVTKCKETDCYDIQFEQPEGYAFIGFTLCKRHFEEAIQALKQEQQKYTRSRYNSINPELNGDMISRQAVCKIIDDIRDCISVEGYWAFLERLKKLPAVNPQPKQPKTGHWIEHPEIETSTPEYLMFYECSECGDRQCFCKSDIHKKRFCSNCGCRMVEPQESEV